MGPLLAGGRRRNLSDLIEHAYAMTQTYPLGQRHITDAKQPSEQLQAAALASGTATLAGTGPHLTDPIQVPATVCFLEETAIRARPTGARRRPRPGSHLAA